MHFVLWMTFCGDQFLRQLLVICLGRFIPWALKGPPSSGPLLKGPSSSGPLLKGPPSSGPLLKGPSSSGPLLKGPPSSGPLLKCPPSSGPLLKCPPSSGPLLKGCLLVASSPLSISCCLSSAFVNNGTVTKIILQ